jgi:hypothetical protein
MAGCFKAQAVGCWPLTAEAWVSPYEICDGQSGTGTGILSSFVSPCHIVLMLLLILRQTGNYYQAQDIIEKLEIHWFNIGDIYFNQFINKPMYTVHDMAVRILTLIFLRMWKHCQNSSIHSSKVEPTSTQDQYPLPYFDLFYCHFLPSSARPV